MTGTSAPPREHRVLLRAGLDPSAHLFSSGSGPPPSLTLHSFEVLDSWGHPGDRVNHRGWKPICPEAMVTKALNLGF